MSRILDAVRTVVWNRVLAATGNTLLELARLQRWERMDLTRFSGRRV